MEGICRVCAMDLRTKHSPYQRAEFLILHYASPTCFVVQLSSQLVQSVETFNFSVSTIQLCQLQLYFLHYKLVPYGINPYPANVENRVSS
jgi:hypothetical protein